MRDPRPAPYRRHVLARFALRATFGLAILLALGASGVLGAARKKRPDLKVTRVSMPAGPVVVGSSLRIRVTTRNVGRRRAKRSATRMYLSRDRKKSKDDRRLGRARLPALRKGKSRRYVVNLPIPVATPAASGYRLLACADDTKKVRERRERNNCRAAKGTLTVAGSAPGGGGGGAPSGGGPSADGDGDGSVDAADCAPSDPAIHPGAADEPDVPAFEDTNCDGIDGDEGGAIFVTPIGDDANPGTRSQPKRTFGSAVAAAFAPWAVRAL